MHLYVYVSDVKHENRWVRKIVHMSAERKSQVIFFDEKWLSWSNQILIFFFLTIFGSWISCFTLKWIANLFASVSLNSWVILYQCEVDLLLISHSLTSYLFKRSELYHWVRLEREILKPQMFKPLSVRRDEHSCCVLQSVNTHFK